MINSHRRQDALALSRSHLRGHWGRPSLRIHPLPQLIPSKTIAADPGKVGSLTRVAFSLIRSCLTKPSTSGSSVRHRRDIPAIALGSLVLHSYLSRKFRQTSPFINRNLDDKLLSGGWSGSSRQMILFHELLPILFLIGGWYLVNSTKRIKLLLLKILHLHKTVMHLKVIVYQLSQCLDF